MFISVIIINRTSWAKSNGIKYQPGDYVITGWQHDDLPSFGCILAVYIMNGVIFLEVTSLISCGIDRHFHSFVLERSLSSLNE